MYTALIVDDFFVEREKVKDIILKSELPITIVGECSNGQEALELLEQVRPDLLLADIEMPFVDGLELAEKVKEKYSTIEVIFLSFYNRFEYARKAIELEAHAYILKPIVREEMLQCLERVIKGIELKRKNQQYEKELLDLIRESKPLLIDKFRRDLFLGLYRDSTDISERIHYLGLTIRGKGYMVLTIEMDDYATLLEEHTLEQREWYSMHISKIIVDRVETQNGAIWVKVDEAHWGVLLSAGEEHEEEIAADTMREAAYILAESILEDSGQNGISLSIGMSPLYVDITLTGKMYENALSALQHKFNLGKGQIIDFEEIHVQSGSINIELKELQEGIAALISSCQESEVRPYIESVFSKYDRYTPSGTIRNLCFSILVCVQMSLDSWNIKLEEVFGREHLLWEKLLRFETILDVKNWLCNSITFILRYIAEKSAKGSKRAIQDARAYIEANYSKGITVNSIADALFYNANYLNNLFKQETGETILEYITRIRIIAAKQLLAENQGMKSYEVGEAVGYSNEAHFRSVFKRYTGVTPKEYRDRIKS